MAVFIIMLYFSLAAAILEISPALDKKRKILPLSHQYIAENITDLLLAIIYNKKVSN